MQVGPEAITLGVLMNKAQGLPHADAAAILKQGFGLTMSQSGICRATQRVGRKAQATLFLHVSRTGDEFNMCAV